MRVCSVNYMGPTTLPKVASVFITKRVLTSLYLSNGIPDYINTWNYATSLTATNKMDIRNLMLKYPPAMNKLGWLWSSCLVQLYLKYGGVTEQLLLNAYWAYLSHRTRTSPDDLDFPSFLVTQMLWCAAYNHRYRNVYLKYDAET